MSPVVPKFRGGISPAPIPGARLSAHETAESLGANVSQQEARTAAVASGVLNNAAETATGLYVRQQAERRREVEDIRARANHLALVKSETDLGQFELSELEVATNLKGPAALEVPEKGMAAWRKRADQIANTLSTPEQKQAFEAVKARRGLNFHATLAQHTAKEMEAYEQNELQASKVNALASMAAYAEDPRRASEELVRAEASTFALEVAQGAGPEKIKAAILETQTQGHASVVARLLALNRAPEAKAYFKKAKASGQIAGTVVTKIEESLQIGLVKDASRQHANTIMAAGGTLTEQLAKAEEIADTDTADATKARIQHQYQVNKAQEREQYETFQDDVYGRLYKAHREKRSLEVLTPTEIQRLGKDYGAFQSETLRLAKGPTRETSAKGERRYWELVDMAYDHPDLFTETSLWNDRSQLSDVDFDRLMTLRRAALNNKAIGKDTIDGDSPAVKAMFAETWVKYTGVDVTPTAKQQEDDKTLAGRIATMRTAVRDAVEVLPKNTPPKRIQEEIDRVFSQQVTTPATRGGYGLYGYLSRTPDTTTNIYDITIADIPATEKKKIIEGIRSAGLPVNDPTILEWYIRARTRRK